MPQPFDTQQVMTYLQKTIKEKTLKEYKEKYPGYPIDENEIVNTKQTTNDKSSQTDTESIMSDYDIIDDTVVPSNSDTPMLNE